MDTSTGALTWQAIVTIEPRLEPLEAELRAVVATSTWCANSHWYGYQTQGNGPKSDLCRLVGWNSTTPALRTHLAYDIAYQYLYDLLPNCRHEGPFC